MPKQNRMKDFELHEMLYEKLVREKILNSSVKFYKNNLCYNELNDVHIKILMKEIIRLAFSVFSPIVCTNIHEKNRIISCMKDAAFGDSELDLEKKKAFPKAILTLYFMRRTNKFNLDRINNIFSKYQNACDNPEAYLPLIQSELIPTISNHIIKIMQIDPCQKELKKQLISQCPILHPNRQPMFTIEEEMEEENVSNVIDSRVHYAF